MDMNVNVAELLQSFYMPLAFIICLCMGYIIKRIDFIPDKFIPLIMGIIGVIVAFISAGFTLTAFASGLASGLASTGFHQLFKQLIEKKDEY